MIAPKRSKDVKEIHSSHTTWQQHNKKRGCLVHTEEWLHPLVRQDFDNLYTLVKDRP